MIRTKTNCIINMFYSVFCVPSTLTLLEVMTINSQKQYAWSGHIFSIYTLLEKLNTTLNLIYLKMTWKPKKSDDFTLKVYSIIGPSPPSDSLSDSVDKFAIYFTRQMEFM